MSAKDYALLKKKGATAGLSANAWLMARLETNRPFLLREEETWEAVRFMNEAGRENNAMHAGVNMIYSNVLQISRHRRAREMDAEAVETLVFLADKLCEEIYLLSTQK